MELSGPEVLTGLIARQYFNEIYISAFYPNDWEQSLLL